MMPVSYANAQKAILKEGCLGFGWVLKVWYILFDDLHFFDGYEEMWWGGFSPFCWPTSFELTHRSMVI